MKAAILYRTSRSAATRRVLKIVFFLAGVGFSLSGKAQGDIFPEAGRGIFYTNIVKLTGPWSIHVVKFPMRDSRMQIRAVHATGHAVGLNLLSEQVRSVESTTFSALAGVNGDFYQREGGHAGDPRGLQIADGELISAPSGSASFWIDALDEPHTDTTLSELSVGWPDGTFSPIGLNGNREPDSIVLYTPAMGASTQTERGRDLILEKKEAGPWLPLRPGRKYAVRVNSVREGANGEIPPGMLVLSLGPIQMKAVPHLEAGTDLFISTITTPSLRGVRTAVSGGPVLLRAGRAEKFNASDSDAFEIASQAQRHPRSAIGWNGSSYFLVEVDGRQAGLSIGMTLAELAEFFLELGCIEAMNLDGGGSATLWFDGKVRNKPCDGGERPIANSLVIGRKQPAGVRFQSANAR
ncbi:MAG TPA: phosphodiester glycosidase family protein [Verrucomicrobiae bacterium]|nr:phosphodiester glycosidase family protein [Verrucomicrobiae bacterium]